jgi:hypothetical protein
MLATYLFWALLLLPGLALLERFAKAELERGLLSAVALGYLASFALLSPFSVACYALHLPVSVFSAAVTAAELLGLTWLARPARLRALGRAFAPDLGVGALVLLALLIASARVGGWLDGDATYHLARVRDLLDHRMSNHDIYLDAPYFSYAYHTNLVHALYASATQLGAHDPLLVWYASLPWAKLVLAAGHYHLAHVLLRMRWAAWLLALGVLAARAGETYTLYPNLLAVSWLAPVMLAVAFRAHEADAEHGRCLGLLAIASFVASEVHALYWAIACVALVPWLAVCALRLLRADRARAGFLALCGLMLLCGAPFALYARFGGQPSVEQTSAGLAEVELDLPEAEASPQPSVQPTQQPKARRSKDPALGGHLEKQLERSADGKLWLPVQAAGGWAFVLLGAGAVCLLVFWPVRFAPGWLALAAAAVSLCALPLLPPACALAVKLLPDFGVARMITLGSSLLLAGMAAVLAHAVEHNVPRAWARAAVSSLAVAAATQLPAQAPRSFAAHVHAVLADERARHELLDQHRARRALLRAHLPRGTALLATLREARYAVMLHDVRVVAADRGHGHVPGLEQRRRQVERMTEPSTPWPVRSELLRHYDLRFLLFRDKQAGRFRWASRSGTLIGQAGGLQLYRLR